MATLESILAQITALDDVLSTEIDPQSLLGEIRDKVDAINFVIDRMTNQAEFLKRKIDDLAIARRTALSNVERIKEYVRFQMDSQKMERLPGNEHYVRLQTSPPALEIKGPPAAEDFLAHPDYVDVQRVFSWKKARIEADIKSGVLKNCSFARITRGNHIRFYLETGHDKLTGSKTAEERNPRALGEPKGPDNGRASQALEPRPNDSARHDGVPANAEAVNGG